MYLLVRAMCRPARITRGQVVAPVDPAGVGGRPGVAQQQRAGLPVGQQLAFLLGLVDGSVGVEPDVTVRVDEPGNDVPAGHDRLGARDRLGADHPPGIHPQVARPAALGQHHHVPQPHWHRRPASHREVSAGRAGGGP